MSSKKNNEIIFKNDGYENDILNEEYESNDSNLKSHKYDVLKGDIDSINSNVETKSSKIDKKLYDEVLYILDGLENGTINLDHDEEIKLRQDLDLILSENYLNSKDSVLVSNKIVENNHNEKFDSNDSNIYPSFNVEDVSEVNGDSNIFPSLSVEDVSEVNSGDVIGESVNNLEDVLLNSEDNADSYDLNDNHNSLLDVPSVESDVKVTGKEDSIVFDEDTKFESVDDALSDLVEDYSNDVVIKVNNVSMEYKVSKDKIDTLKEFFIRTLKRNKEKTKTITALKNVSFEIPKGDRVGIIGFNGAGKSTLLKLLSRVYDPTEGTIETKGKIAPLLELGAGFDMNYTGKANIFLNGAFLGFSEDFIKEKYDEIVEFSELGDAINYHVKTYSSGMRAKLGFSIATIVEPDILIIDEILSVGDIKFQRKSSDKIRSLINSGITVLLVSHSVNQIRELCNKAIWIDNGEIKKMGEVNEVCDAYVKAANDATQEQLKNINLD